SCPTYKALADAIADGIADGSLPPGSRMPTHRDLAWTLGVTVTTITRGYHEAQRRGLIDGTVGRGTFVRGGETLGRPPVMDPRYAIEHRSPDGPIDMSLGFPVLSRQPALLAETLAAIAAEGGNASYLNYGPDGGLPAHRAAGVTWLGRLGLAVTPDRVVLTNGAQQAIAAAMMAVCRTGDCVLMEELTFPGAKALAPHLGLRSHGVAMDDEGIIPAALEDACHAYGPTLLYTTPTQQNPTSRTMSLPRRETIAEIARRHRLTIIEDDIYGHLPETPITPLAAFAPERTIYITSCSKGMAPGLRVGFAAAPPDLVPRLAAGVRVMSWMVPPLMAEIARRWIESGIADMLIDDLRSTALRRRALADDILGHGLTFQAPPRCFHLWTRLPPGWNAETFVNQAHRAGVILQTPDVFAVGRCTVDDHIRLCMGTEPSESRYVEGLHRLARVLEDGHAGAVAVM
ncbi:MAG: PLP-dependent aminotransferase family protein, partial [Rhodospirillaceae bacterium]